MPTTKSAVRKSVPLHHEDLKDLQRVRSHGSIEAIALHELTGVTLGEKPSEAEALHAIVEAGRQAIALKAEEIGYQRLAEFLKTDDESQRWRASRRTRAARRHAPSGERSVA